MTDRDYSDDHRGPPHPPAQTDFPSLLRAGYFGRSRAARLREWAEDPMWADHAEVPKLLCSEAANEIDLLRAALADLVGQIEVFTASYGEADFEIGQAKTLLRWSAY